MAKETKTIKKGSRKVKKILKGAALVAAAYGAKKLYEATKKKKTAD